MKFIGNDREKQLILNMQQGDHKAMKIAYDRYAGYLTAVCSRYVLDPEDVRDILQDSFIKIFTHIGQYEFRENASLKSWMTRIVVNESLKFLQKSSRYCFIEKVDEYPELPDAELNTTEIPFAQMQEMIRALPVGYRTVFNLYVFERKSHQEIATLLNIKENSSASQFHRAKNLLAMQIKKQLNHAT